MSNQNESAIVKSARGLATVLSLACAFFLTPQIHDLTAKWIISYTNAHYSGEWMQYVDPGWFGTIAFTLFFATRMILVAVLSLLPMAIAVRRL